MQSVYTIDGNDFSKYDHELEWNGSEQDIDDFVNGIISMDDLKTKSNSTK